MKVLAKTEGRERRDGAVDKKGVVVEQEPFTLKIHLEARPTLLVCVPSSSNHLYQLDSRTFEV